MTIEVKNQADDYADAKIARQTVFEIRACGRCGGCGRYSWCSMHGDTCFGCGGRGWQYTKRGAAAAAFLADSLKKRADEFVVGDLLKVDAVPGFQGSYFATVIEVKTNEDGTISIDTESKSGSKFRYAGAQPDQLLRPGRSNEEKAAARVAAVEYQATLTKQGKPRKRLPKEV